MLKLKEGLYPWLFWVAVVLQGLVFISTTAIWDGFDEPLHYAYIQHLAENGTLPVYGKTLLSKEVTRSFELAPLSSAFNSILGGRYTTFADYRRLTDESRRDRAQALRSISKEDRTVADTSNPISNYEVHQTPLYYLIAVPVYRMCSSLDLPTRVFCLRLFSLLIGSLTLFAAYAAARRAFRGHGEPRTVLFVLAFMPMFITTIARISNDALAVPLGSLVVFLVIDYFVGTPNSGRAIQIGIVLGLGLLTKAYFLAVLAAATAIFAAAVCVSTDKRRLLHHLAILLVLAASISSWWYARNYMLYGNFSGMQELTLTAGLSIANRLAMVARVPWLTTWHGMIKQHIWLGNMSLLELSRATYDFGYCLILLASLGLCGCGISILRRVLAKRARTSTPCLFNESEMRDQDRILVIVILFYAFFLLATAYHMWQNFILVRMPGGTGGYYLYAAIVPELILLVYGLKALPWGAAKMAQAITAGYVLVVNFIAYFCKAIPFYAGYSIQHFHLHHLIELYSPSTFTLLLKELSLQQASWIGPRTILVILFGYLFWMVLVTRVFYSRRTVAGEERI